MSSTTNNTSCPNCGGNARIETDHNTGETNTWCDDGCGFESINGFVVSEGSEDMAFVPDDYDEDNDNDYYDDEGEF